MLNPKNAKKLTEAVGRLFNDILNPEAPLNPLKTRTTALKIAREFGLSNQKTADFVALSLKARRNINQQLNKGYASFIDKDTTLVVNLREATNQQIKKAIVNHLKKSKSLNLKKLEGVFNIALEGAITKQQADFNLLTKNEVNTLIERLTRSSDDIAQVINEYSPFGKKGTQNLADMVKSENWSLLSMVLVALESTVQAFNRMGINIDAKTKRRLYARFFKVSAATGRSLIKRKNGKIIKHQSDSEFSKLFNELKYGLSDRNLTRKKVMDSTLNFIVNELEKDKLLRSETNKKHAKAGVKVYELFEKAIAFESEED